MRRFLFVLAVASLSSALAGTLGCDGLFTSCEETRTCPMDLDLATGGVDGVGGAGGAGGALQVDSSVALSLPETIFIEPGGAVTANVGLATEGLGSDDEITIAVEGLPDGVGVMPKTAAPQETVLNMEVLALESAAVGGPFPIEFVARRQSDGEVLERFEVMLYVRGDAGAADVSFGDEGTLALLQSSSRHQPRDITFDSQGRLLVAAYTHDAGAETGWVGRVLPEGALDESFANDGFYDEFPSPGQAEGAFKIFPSKTGFKVFAVSEGKHLVRRLLNTSGAVDSSFGTDGEISLPKLERLAEFGDGYAGANRGESITVMNSDGDPIPSATLADSFVVLDTGILVAVNTAGGTVALSGVLPHGAIAGTYDQLQIDGGSKVAADVVGIALPHGEVALLVTWQDASGESTVELILLAAGGTWMQSFSLDGRLRIDEFETGQALLFDPTEERLLVVGKDAGGLGVKAYRMTGEPIGDFCGDGRLDVGGSWILLEPESRRLYVLAPGAPARLTRYWL